MRGIMTKIKIRPEFTSPYEQYRDRIGQRFDVLKRITRRNATPAERKDINLECLPMYRIRFIDGHETLAWPEEVESGWYW